MSQVPAITFITKHRAIIGTIAIALIVPALTVSEKSLKSFLEEWFDSCSIIVDISRVKQEENSAYLPIRLFVVGTPPKQASLVVSANEPVFTQLSYFHDLATSNRALHPGITTTSYPSLPFHNIEVDLTPFYSRYYYSFRANLAPDKIHGLRTGRISHGAFIRFSGDTEDDICRVERANFFNSLVGASSTHRFFFLVFLIPIFTALIWLFRRE